MANIIWGSTTKPVASRQLADAIESVRDLDGTLYIGYPILGTPEGAFPFDALLLSPLHGAIAFDVVEGRELGDFRGRQDNLFAKLQSKLLQYPALVHRRQLAVAITVVTFAPAAAVPAADEDYPICKDRDELSGVIDGIDWPDRETYPPLCSAIQALTNVRKGRRKREAVRPDSRGAKLQLLNSSIANLDAHQGAAVVETVEGVQRIRGLAGSGKTIVLALKVAYLHAQHPDWDIAVTFNTRSLKGQFERLINTFVIEQTSEEPDWDRVQIMHSWGSPSAPAGLYYQFARDNGLPYLDFQSARSKFGENKEFKGACEEALAATPNPVKRFDAIMVDEAQDLPPAFLQLCYATLKEPKRLVYAYDELQSLTNASLPSPEEIFGSTPEGRPVVSFEPDAPGKPRQDIILERCYRNPRPILVTAHALGFGIYRQPGGLIQIFDQSQLWLDVGYSVVAGELADGQDVTLARTPETSPTFLESHSALDDLIQFRAFDTTAEQDEWLVQEILRNLREDELTPEDIIVINPEPLKTRKAVAKARARLFEEGINTSLAGVSSSPDVFFENDVVTFTGIFRAKGNEAGMVYVINAHDCYDAFIPAWLTRARNQLFTAITRSKAWVRVLGIGPDMRSLAAEYERVRANAFTLHFQYPDEAKRRALHTVNRDMTRAERARLTKNVADLEKILTALDEGELQAEDLPPAMRKRLERLLQKG
jgi:superfamily I DNA and RNA helicase